MSDNGQVDKEAELLEKIKELAKKRQLKWKKHALKRLFERKITRAQVFEAIKNSEIIERHKLKRPLETCLILGYYKDKPLHVMLALDEGENMIWVITVYEPTVDEWLEDYKIRRKR